MQKLSLNFQQSFQKNQWLGLTLLIVGLMALTTWYLQFSANERKLAEMEQTLDKQAHAIKKQPAIQSSQDKVAEEKSQQQQVLQQKIIANLNLAWPALFNALQNSKPEAITLLDIVPEVSSHHLQISGQAHSLYEVLQYIEALKKETSVVNPALKDHQVVNQENTSVVHFDIEAIWN